MRSLDPEPISGIPLVDDSALNVVVKSFHYANDILRYTKCL